MTLANHVKSKFHKLVSFPRKKALFMNDSEYLWFWNGWGKSRGKQWHKPWFPWSESMVRKARGCNQQKEAECACCLFGYLAVAHLTPAASPDIPSLCGCPRYTWRCLPHLSKSITVQGTCFSYSHFLNGLECSFLVHHLYSAINHVKLSPLWLVSLHHP